jgi:hypothetical protein
VPPRVSPPDPGADRGHLSVHLLHHCVNVIKTTTTMPTGTTSPLGTIRPHAHSRVAARGAIVGAISDMTPDGGQQAQLVSSPEPVDPPNT